MKRVDRGVIVASWVGVAPYGFDFVEDAVARGAVGEGVGCGIPIGCVAAGGGRAGVGFVEVGEGGGVGVLVGGEGGDGGEDVGVAIPSAEGGEVPV